MNMIMSGVATGYWENVFVWYSLENLIIKIENEIKYESDYFKDIY